MSTGITKAGLTGSALSMLAAACCVLPMAFMLVGLGGSWVAVFGMAAAAGYYVGGAAAVLLAVAWIVALRRRTSAPTVAMLSAGTVGTALAWVVMLNETAINDYLISLM